MPNYLDRVRILERELDEIRGDYSQQEIDEDEDLQDRINNIESDIQHYRIAMARTAPRPNAPIDDGIVPPSFNVQREQLTGLRTTLRRGRSLPNVDSYNLAYNYDAQTSQIRSALDINPVEMLGSMHRPEPSLSPRVPASFNAQKCQITLRASSNKIFIGITSERNTYSKTLFTIIPLDETCVLRRELLTDIRYNDERHLTPTFGLQLAVTGQGTTKILETKEEIY